MNTRIREVRRDAGLTQEEFAKKIGLTKNYISLVETGDRNLGERALKDLCETFGVSREWVKTGNGEKNVSITVVKQLSDIFDLVAHDPDDSFRKSVFLGLARLNPEDWEALKEITKKVLGIKNARTESGQSTETTSDSVAAAEAIYEKSLHSAQNTASSASNITDDTEQLA